MTSPTRKPSLDAVLDEFFYTAEKLDPALIFRACESYPDYRNEILEFCALWSAHDSLPVTVETETLTPGEEEALVDLQSFVLNKVYEADSETNLVTDLETAKEVIAKLGGGALRRTSAIIGLGGATLLLQKILTNSIRDVPNGVLLALASQLRIATAVLSQAISGAHASIGRSYKAMEPPLAPRQESWQAAVKSLGVTPDERKRLLELEKEGVRDS